VTFFEEMAALVVELLGPGSDFGEQLRIERAVDQYDPDTRKKVKGPPLVQLPFGTCDSDLAPVTAAGTLTRKHQAVMTAVPVENPEFIPGVDDRVIDMAGQHFVIVETGHVIKQGVQLVWIAGLQSA